jgi:type III pantothenate kinase
VIVAIDAGNTRIKWGVHEGEWLAHGVLEHRALDGLGRGLDRFPAPRLAIVSSVAGAAVDAAIRDLLGRRAIEVRWVISQMQACGVSNRYAQPAQLGSDRWAALIAAWHRHKAACLVVSAGTALTVDALSSRGEFIGGLIVPGRAMMQQALADNTAGVGIATGEFRLFPDCTGDAVASGALQAMAGAVQRMQDALTQREGSAPALLLSGGDAAQLQPVLSGAGEIVDNLVLEGLVLIAGECR